MYYFCLLDFDTGDRGDRQQVPRILSARQLDCLRVGLLALAGASIMFVVPIRYPRL